jgi:transporter family protein
MKILPSWLLFSLGSAFFAGLAAILGKLGVAGMNSNLATHIRTVVIFVVTAAIVAMRAEWVWPKDTALKPAMFPGAFGRGNGFFMAVLLLKS